MIDTEIVQRCGCGEDDCVEILGLEESIYACFTCGYAGVTPSGADNYEDEIHIGNLEAEVERLQKALISSRNVVDELVVKMRIEQQIVQAFYEYRDAISLGSYSMFTHCEAWMLEKGHRIMVNGQSEWAAEIQEEEE